MLLPAVPGSAMTVAELIEVLQQIDERLEVEMKVDGYYDGPVLSVEKIQRHCAPKAVCMLSNDGF